VPSTFALNNATIGPGLALADHGWQAALRGNAHLKAGPNVANGKVRFEAVARALGYDYAPADALLD
jgi:alanine dehydrogenase